MTKLLVQATDGDQRAANELLPMVYQQLRAIANMRMESENPGHTLQATALVNEVFLRMFGNRKLPWQNRAHFYAPAAEAMRRVLLDHAKAKRRKKRGGSGKKMPLNVAELAGEQNSEQILALDAALCRLEEQNPAAAGVVRLRFYAGLSVDQTAAALDMSPRTVDRRWKFARAWLFDQLSESD
ncbi:MAG: ECF-type sigma factor [Bythopirellula sp.]